MSSPVYVYKRLEVEDTAVGAATDVFVVLNLGLCLLNSAASESACVTTGLKKVTTKPEIVKIFMLSIN